MKKHLIGAVYDRAFFLESTKYAAIDRAYERFRRLQHPRFSRGVVSRQDVS
jgi:hypothetical protein